ncbi:MULTISPECIES: multicopper oxidase domain-containing protein [Cryobacterium]|uniref:Copper-containing nitrite reductase n=1 Tax=Cryobacterium shii TaxID=1259235 RepID=A0AAQ2HGS9_9MICO|nr:MULTISPECIES: multicopper oxidase domain-containing protein [Cryobacterium]TFC52149.1 copper oxidase [Cryobacterium shii]TFD19420.1 copper oxidase [Cryobacterium sp. TMT4-10]TFD26745.1 copper oxidase [Cryobacterium sp. TMT2-23]
MSRRLWHLLTGLLVPAWLVLTVVAVLFHRFLPVAPWLMVHLLLLGAVSTAILTWSQHFADTLLRRSAPGGRASMGVRLLTHTVGAALVVAGMVGGWWPLVLVGGSLVGANALLHAGILFAQSRGSLPARFAPLVRYYLAAGVALSIGVTLGVLMARTDEGEPFERLFVAHIGLNLLGWVGLTVIGTVALLWPTVLHARVQTTRASARGTLPLLLAGLAVLGLGALADQRLVTALGALLYLVGLGLVLVEAVRLGRTSPPTTFASWSIGAALAWFFLCVAGFGLLVAFAPSWVAAADRLEQLVPVFAVGFAAQILLGALSYLLPVVLGGGPRVSRPTARELDRGALFRVIVVNGGLVLYLLPVPSLVRVTLSLLVVGTLASFLVLMTRAMRVNRRVRRATDASASPIRPAGGPAATGAEQPRRTGATVTAVGALLLVVTLGVAMDPAAAGMASGAASAGVSASGHATGHTTRVDVRMKDTRFSPDRIEIPAGDTLVITLTNADDMVHNLVLATGVVSGSVAPGTSKDVTIGVVGTDIDGWCSIAGHKLLGMTLTVVAVGADPAGDAAMPAGHASAGGESSAADDLDLMKKPAADFTARDAVLPPVSVQTGSTPNGSTPTVHTLTMRVKNVTTEVSPGVTQSLWTFNGTAPGPTLHGRVGDVFDITFVNDGSIEHSIDFHAGALAPDKAMRSIAPGQSLSYRFTATSSGIWLYHCSTMPMSVHIANGMFGAVVIDPAGLTPVDREYVLVQSELYLGAQGGEADADKVAAQFPDLVVFNGIANQYGARPLTAKVGERVRVWVLDAGPNVGSSFHVVGGQFDTVFKEGDYLLRDGGSTGTGGSQVLDLAAAQGGFVELTFPEAGSYPFVSHVMSDAEKGARGVFQVTP